MLAPVSGVEVIVQDKSVDRFKAAGFVLADKPKKNSRPTKKELLEEIGETHTNPELAEMAGKEKPKKKKAKKKAKE